MAFCEKSDIFARIRYYIIPANHDLSITRVLHVPVIFNLTWYTRIRVKRVLYGVSAHHVYYKGQLKRVVHMFCTVCNPSFKRVIHVQNPFHTRF